MTLAQTKRWLDRALHEEGVPLDRVYRDKLVPRIERLLRHELADSLTVVANTLAGQATAVRMTGPR